MQIRTDLLTILAALWGAFLSTVLAVRALAKDTRKVRMIGWAAMLPAQGAGWHEFFGIDVVNIGHRSIKIVSAGLCMSNGKVFTLSPSNAGRSPLPTRLLEDGDMVSILFDSPEIERYMKKDPIVRPTGTFVIDAQGRGYPSEFPGTTFMEWRKLEEWE